MFHHKWLDIVPCATQHSYQTLFCWLYGSSLLFCKCSKYLWVFKYTVLAFLEKNATCSVYYIVYLCIHIHNKIGLYSSFPVGPYLVLLSSLHFFFFNEGDILFSIKTYARLECPFLKVCKTIYAQNFLCGKI